MVPSDVPVCVRVIAVDCLPDETRANRLVVPLAYPPAHARRQALAEARVPTAEEGGEHRTEGSGSTFHRSKQRS